MNALGAEMALVLDDLSAELILTRHVQGVQNVEAHALGTAIPASHVNAHVSPCAARTA